MNSRKIILAKNPKLENSRNSRKFLQKISRIFPFAKVSSAKVSSFKVLCIFHFIYLWRAPEKINYGKYKQQQIIEKQDPLNW